MARTHPRNVLALGIVGVLLSWAQIDLSVSGLSAAVTAVTTVNLGWPLWAAVIATIALGLRAREATGGACRAPELQRLGDGRGNIGPAKFIA